MSIPRIHFCYEPYKIGKESLHSFVKTLQERFGQSSMTKADILVSVGGDGTLLDLMRKAKHGQKVLGIVPPNSNSRGFWTNGIVNDADELLQKLIEAESYSISPLKAVITHRDGKTTLLRAFNEVAPSETNGQALLGHFSIDRVSGKKIGPIRLMGDGIIMATAFGSTALNSTYNGAAIDIRNSGIAVVGKGVYEPRNFRNYVADDQAKFEIEFLSDVKRPVRVLFDGKRIVSRSSNPFQSITVEKDKDFSLNLLLTDDPVTRVFADIFPR